MFQKVSRYLNKPAEERRRLFRQRMQMASAWPFRLGKAHLPFTFLAYLPDSHAHFASHQEYDDLFRSFVAHNKLNNAGDVTRLWSFMLNIKQVIAEGVVGDFAELGVWRGNTAAVLAHYAAASGRRVQLFDTFQGFDARDLDGVDSNKAMAFADTSMNLVKQVIGSANSACDYIKGYFPDSLLPRHFETQYAVVSIDCDLHDPMKSGLAFFYPRMPTGGLLMLHDYSSMHWDGAKLAIDEFCKAHGEHVILLPDKSGSAFIRKAN